MAKANNAMLERLANVSSVTWLDADEEPPPNALALVGDLKVMIPLAGLIDIVAEVVRIEKDIEKAQADLQKVEGKLNNENFVSKAPQEVVAKEREKASALQARISALRQQVDKLNRTA